jgi:glycosyltransferase involved in cell wall biosynthesis
MKGFDRLIKVVKRLNDENLDFDLWIVGEGADREKLERYIKENNLKNVTLLGLQSNPYKYISKADLLVCSSRYEGFNLTVAEGLILERPVLSTNCTGPTEILDDGKYGMIVENSEDGLFEGLKKLIQDKNLLEDYKEKAKLRKDFFDEDKILKEIENLF